MGRTVDAQSAGAEGATDGRAAAGGLVSHFSRFSSERRRRQRGRPNCVSGALLPGVRARGPRPSRYRARNIVVLSSFSTVLPVETGKAFRSINARAVRGGRKEFGNIFNAPEDQPKRSHQQNSESSIGIVLGFLGFPVFKTRDTETHIKFGN